MMDYYERAERLGFYKDYDYTAPVAPMQDSENMNDLLEVLNLEDVPLTPAEEEMIH